MYFFSLHFSRSLLTFSRIIGRAGRTRKLLTFPHVIGRKICVDRFSPGFLIISRSRQAHNCRPSNERSARSAVPDGHRNCRTTISFLCVRPKYCLFVGRTARPQGPAIAPGHAPLGNEPLGGGWLTCSFSIKGTGHCHIACIVLECVLLLLFYLYILI